MAGMCLAIQMQAIVRAGKMAKHLHQPDKSGVGPKIQNMQAKQPGLDSTWELTRPLLWDA